MNLVTEELVLHLTALVWIRNELSRNLVEIGRYKKKHSPWLDSRIRYLAKTFEKEIAFCIEAYSQIITELKHSELVNKMDLMVLKIMSMYRLSMIPAYDFDLLLSCGFTNEEVVQFFEIGMYRRKQTVAAIKEFGVIGIMQK